MFRSKLVSKLLSVFLMIAYVGPNIAAAQEPVPIVPTESADETSVISTGWITDPARIPPGPLPASKPGEGSEAGTRRPVEDYSVNNGLIWRYGGDIYFGTDRMLHANAFTVAYTNYRDVEQWLYRWNGSQWVQEGYKKESSYNIARVDANTDLACWSLVNGALYTQTSRHFASNSLFDYQRIDKTNYPHVTAACS